MEAPNRGAKKSLLSAKKSERIHIRTYIERVQPTPTQQRSNTFGFNCRHRQRHRKQKKGPAGILASTPNTLLCCFRYSNFHFFTLSKSFVQQVKSGQNIFGKIPLAFQSPLLSHYNAPFSHPGKFPISFVGLHYTITPVSYPLRRTRLLHPNFTHSRLRIITTTFTGKLYCSSPAVGVITLPSINFLIAEKNSPPKGARTSHFK